MEKRENEDPDAFAETSGAAAAEVQNPEETDHATDPVGTASADNNPSAPDTGDTGDDTGDDTGKSPAGSDGEGDENPDPGDGDGGHDHNPEEDDPDKADDPLPEGKSEFEERFLSAPSGETRDAAEEKERLAVSLLKMALTLLTDRIPDDRFIPLMNATLAYEAIKAAREEGEIAGRNAVIEERLVTPPVGAPDLSGTPIARSRRPVTSIFDLANEAK